MIGKPEDYKIEAAYPRPIGGQQCGMGNPAIKITHLPTNNVAICGTERSQLRNREVALEMIEWSLVSARGGAFLKNMTND